MQPALEIIHYPIDLSEFGKTPSGAQQFRVVKASTRTDKLYHLGKMHTLPRYAEHGHKWIIERWLPVDRLLGKTREEWEEMFRGVMFGHARPEYPADGDFEYVYHFDGPVDEQWARRVAAMILFDETNATDAERVEAFKEAEQAKEEASDARRYEKIAEIMTRTPEEPSKHPVSSLSASPSVLLSKEND